MNILVTGGSGFIGHQLIKILEKDHQLCILSRHPANAAKKLGTSHHYLQSLDNETELNGFDAVINLAGEPIAAKRWSGRQKHEICDSRWRLTSQLAELIKKSDSPPEVLINASAVGYYGSHDEEKLDESYIPTQANRKEFSHIVCDKWEKLALSAASEATRVCVIRTGLVLGLSGGALPKMLPAFSWGLGGPIGHGRQGMSWIHERDQVALIVFLLGNKACHGIYNATSPNPVNNRDFTRALAKAINRPAFIPAPEFALKIALGEMSTLLTQGQFVYPKRAVDAGFQFEFTYINDAFNALLSQPD